MNTLEIFTAEDQTFLDLALGKSEIDPTLDQVFRASEMGKLTPEFERNADGKSTGIKLLEGAKTRASASRELVVDPGNTNPAGQFGINVMRQFHQSGLFLAFDEPNVRVNMHSLKYRPVSEWPEKSRQVLKALYPNLKLEDFFNDSWVYTYLDKLQTMDVGGVPVLSTHYEVPLRIRNLDRNARAPEYNFVKSSIQREGQLAFEKQLIANGHLPTRNQDLLNVREVHIPLDIIDWNRSVMTVNVSRNIPSNSLVAKAHRVTVAASANGKEAVVIEATSGPLREALLKSRIAQNIPQHWDMVPERFRRVPQTVAEVDDYIAWLNQVEFPTWKKSNLLENQAPQSQPRLGW